MWIINKIRSWFITGIIVTGPIALTIILIRYIVSAIDDFVYDNIKIIYPQAYDYIQPYAGFGLIIAIIFLMFIGMIFSNLVGRLFIKIGEYIVNKIPVVKFLYNFLKQVFDMLGNSISSNKSFGAPVLIEYPKKGVYALAFLTSKENEFLSRTNGIEHENYYNIFLPTTPNPTSGFYLIVHKDDVKFLDVHRDDAMKIIISAGMIHPLKKKDENIKSKIQKAKKK